MAETITQKLIRVESKLDAVLEKLSISVPKKYVMVNAITWGDNPLAVGTNLFPDTLSEATLFVLPTNSDGTLQAQTSEAIEQKFVNDMHSAGRLVSFSIAGGSQSASDIISAVTQKTNLVNNIASRIIKFGYDAVILDIENVPTLNPLALNDFVLVLRTKIGQDKKIGMYTQPSQLTTSHAKIELVSDALTWLSVMVYDFQNTVEEFKTITLQWLPKVKGNKLKLLAGAAVNYDTTGLNQAEFAQILDWINTEGLGGIGIWNNVLFTQPYRDILKSKFNI